MKKLPNKIILNLFLIMLFSACHTLEHHGSNLELTKKNIVNQEIREKDINYNNNINVSSEKFKITKKIREKEPKKATKPSEFTISKKIKETEPKKFRLTSLLKLSETKLFEVLGKSDFVKFEGQLKNHQYYFSKCFLDVFVIRQENVYYVNFVQTRSIKLNGTLNKEECLLNINKKLRTLAK